MAQHDVVHKYAIVLTGDTGSISFTKPLATCYIRNLGPAPCLITINGAGVIVRADGSPKLASNEALNLQDVSVKSIGIGCLAGGAQCEIDATGTVALAR